MFILSNSHFHLLLSYGNSPQWLPSPFLLGFHLGSRFIQIGGSWTSYPPLSFALEIMAKLLCSKLCLFGANYGLELDVHLFQLGPYQ